MPSQSYEEGNLAALEETDPRMRAPVRTEKTSDAPTTAPKPVELTMPSAKKSNLTAVMVVVALAVLAAGAWFGGLIPH